MSAAARWHIIGTGPVALSCALFLVRRGVPALQIALTAQVAPTVALPATLARRTLAISEGSRQLLSRISTLPPAGRIEQVCVSLRGHLGRTRITGDDLGHGALGYVVRYGALLAALQESAARHDWAPLSGTAEPAPDVLIHAEGDAGDDAVCRDFGQAALLAEVNSPQLPAAVAHQAFERFTPNGPLALLPLPEPRRWSLVWCDQPAQCAERTRLSSADFNAALQKRFGDTLGPLHVDSPRQVVPLQRRTRRRVVQDHAAWIGNAAQSLHPVAGQGLNLGLRDAFELADSLAHAQRTGQPMPATLRAWQKQRRPDRWLTTTVTDLMAASFTWPAARPLQSGLLGALDLLPTLRQPLARQLAFGWRS